MNRAAFMEKTMPRWVPAPPFCCWWPLILHYGDLMLTTKLMVGVLTLSLLGVIFNRLLDRLEKWVIPWKN